MKILCNACEAAEARVMCCADEAALCSACDEKVHAANKLAGKHQRVPLIDGGGSTTAPKCDICQEASAFFFCLEDRAVLCKNCDTAIHTANTLVSAHQRFLLAGVRVGLEPFEPVTPTLKQQPNYIQRTVESPSKSFPPRSSQTNGIFSDELSKEVLESSKLSFIGAAMTGSMPDWPMDEFFGFMDFNENFGFTSHTSSKGDVCRLESCEGSPLSHSADSEPNACSGQLHEIPCTVPQIPSPGTASGLHWLRDLQYPAPENEFFVPDVCSLQGLPLPPRAKTMAVYDSSREPFPGRLLDDVGGSFSIGAVGGSIFHIIKGINNSPNGKRLAGGITSIRMNVPRISGSFAVWGGVFSTFDCTMVYLRQKEDPWNSILAGAATGGFLSMRRGIRASAKSAALGGVFLCLVEGAMVLLNNAGAPIEEEIAAVSAAEAASPPPEVSTGSSSWFGRFAGLFGREKKQESSGASKNENLEGFDTPSPSFHYK